MVMLGAQWHGKCSGVKRAECTTCLWLKTCRNVRKDKGYMGKTRCVRMVEFWVDFSSHHLLKGFVLTSCGGTRSFKEKSEFPFKKTSAARMQDTGTLKAVALLKIRGNILNQDCFSNTHIDYLILSFRSKLASRSYVAIRILQRIGEGGGRVRARVTAASLALRSEPNFWTVSTLVNIWLFALKLFVCNDALNILHRAGVWPWDGRILTNFIIYIETEPFGDMKDHFFPRYFLFFTFVSSLIYGYQKKHKKLSLT